MQASNSQDSEQASTRWSFANFELSPEGGRLIRDGSEVALAPKMFEILGHLMRHRERIVSREELLETVWGTTRVSEAAVSSVIRDLRRALDDSAMTPRFIATFRGRGL